MLILTFRSVILVIRSIYLEKDADPDLSFSDSSYSEYIPVSVKDADPDLSFCDSSDAEYIYGKDAAL